MAQVETDVRNLGREFRAVVAVADALERVGSLEQAERDAKGAMETARRATADAQKLRREVEGELVVAQEEVDASSQKARLTLSDAGIKAREIVKIAEAKAREIVSEATTEAVTLRENIKQDREAHDLFMEDVGRQHEQAQEALDAINVELKALRERIG